MYNDILDIDIHIKIPISALYKTVIDTVVHSCTSRSLIQVRVGMIDRSLPGGDQCVSASDGVLITW